MSDPAVDVVEHRFDSDAATILDRLLAPQGADFVLLRRSGVTITPDALSHLVRACEAPMAATASPVPSASATKDAICSVPVHDRLPPPASIAVPCLDACVISRESLRSLPTSDVAAGTSPRDAILAVYRRLVDVGWRHVTTPGTALDWSPLETGEVAPAGGWSQRIVRELAGPANEGLSTHQLWAQYSLRGPRIVVDGACLTDSPHNGSQKLVLDVSRWMKRVRPDSSITLAVPDDFVGYFRERLLAEGIEVMRRRHMQHRFDLVYRPYQLIDPSEVAWLLAAGDRLLVGQLDMIGFSNPSYHPSPALFHSVRNLQRWVLRLADGVTFISAFGQQVAFAECPNLESRRMFVVSCGTESEASDDSPPLPGFDGVQDFLLCLSATFWHKNRQHALRVFAQLCELHSYQGALVIAGPEPYYGRSAGAERRVVDSMPADVAARVVRVGQIDEATKWQLLRRARLVLYPSVVEGFGLVPFEAAAVGTPSLSHAGSGLAELIDDGACLVRGWCVEEWAAKANELITDPRRSAEAVAAVNQAARSHTWEHAARLTWEAIDATVASPRLMSQGEEGGWVARIAPRREALAAGARTLHFVDRVVAHVKRRFGDR